MTLYTGPDKWKKPRRIKEMMSVSKRLDQFINDWKILVVDIKLLNERKISCRKLREIVMLTKAMYEENYKAKISLYAKKVYHSSNIYTYKNNRRRLTRRR